MCAKCSRQRFDVKSRTNQQTNHPLTHPPNAQGLLWQRHGQLHSVRGGLLQGHSRERRRMLQLRGWHGAPPPFLDSTLGVQSVAPSLPRSLWGTKKTLLEPTRAPLALLVHLSMLSGQACRLQSSDPYRVYIALYGRAQLYSTELVAADIDSLMISAR